MSSEVFEWLRSISNGLNLERLAKEFEVRGFVTRQSLKYIQKEDLDAFFPSPQKLLLAEKRILQTEINNLKEPTLPPRELFPSVQDQKQPFSPSAVVQHINDKPSGMLPALVTSGVNLRPATLHLQSLENAQPADSKPEPTQSSSSYLDRRQVQLSQDVQLMQVQLNSAKHQLALRKKEIDDCEKNKGVKICSSCHLPGHTKLKCQNGSCLDFHSCKLPAKHPEVNKELQELKTLIKDLEKKETKAKIDLELFSSARQRAASSFFAVMRPRLRKQNPIKYIDRSALDKDLLVLKKALGNKIPLNESRDWELPFVIERFKHSNVEVSYL